MLRRACTTSSLCLVAALLAGTVPAGAQAPDGAIAPRGSIRFDVAGTYAEQESRFASAGTEPLGAWYSATVQGASVEAAAVLEQRLRDFFAATGEGGPSLSPAAITFGATGARLHASTRQVPMRLAIGIVPRGELTLTLPVEREELLVQGVGLSGATLGRNPDRTRNAALLGQISESWRALGASSFLPLANSPAGQALRERVESLTEGELELPTEAASGALLSDFVGEEGRPASGARPWRIGDLEVGGRYMLFSTFGARAFPAAPAPLHLRVTAAAAARLPTGQAAEPADPFTLLPTVGRSGFRAGADVDLFAGRRWWLAGGAQLLRLQEGENRFEGEGPVVVVWSPASEVALRLAPRYRLTDAISFGARYEMARSASEHRETLAERADFLVTTPSGLVQRAGVEIRYSTLPVIEAVAPLLRNPFAIEVGLGYLHTFAAPAGVPASRAVVLQGSLLGRLWGSGR